MQSKGNALTECHWPRTTTTLDIKSIALNSQIFPINTLHRLLLTIKLSSSIEECRAGRTLYREGKHHAHSDQIIFGLLAFGDKLRVEVGGDVFVQDLTFTHDWLFRYKYYYLVAEVVDRSRRAEIGSRMSPPSEVRSQKLELEKWKWKMENGRIEIGRRGQTSDVRYLSQESCFWMVPS